MPAIWWHYFSFQSWSHCAFTWLSNNLPCLEAFSSRGFFLCVLSTWKSLCILLQRPQKTMTFTLQFKGHQMDQPENKVCLIIPLVSLIHLKTIAVFSPLFSDHCIWAAGHPELCLWWITSVQWHWPWNHWACCTCLIELPCVCVSLSECATFAI